MRRPAALLLAALLLATAARADDPAKRRLKIDWTPHAGDRFSVTDEATSWRKLETREEKKASSTTETKDEHAFALGWEIVAIDSKARTGKEKRAYTKASIKHDADEDTSLEGKTLTVERPKIGVPTAAIEPRAKLGKLALELVEELKFPEEATARSPLEPKAPVAAGDSWELDVEAALKLVGDPFLKASPDKKASSARAKLVTLVEKEGALHGKIEVAIDAKLSEFEDALTFDEGGNYAIRASVECFLDGSRPDREVSVTGSVDGKQVLNGAEIVIAARHTKHLVVKREK